MGILLAIPASTVINPTPVLATVSGNNGRIAYVTDIDGDLEIYTINPDGSDPVNVTNRSRDRGSPDRRHLPGVVAGWTTDRFHPFPDGRRRR